MPRGRRGRHPYLHRSTRFAHQLDFAPHANGPRHNRPRQAGSSAADAGSQLEFVIIDLVIDQRRKDLGGFEVGRVLPWARRMVGPFVFFDHMGPAEFAAGLSRNVGVRPHPHIGLSTITCVFAAEIMHRDSVGSVQPIRAGEINWMTAGSGITHSERLEKTRAKGDRPRFRWNESVPIRNRSFT